MSRPAPALRSVAALAAHDLRVTARRGENVLVTLVIPIAVLLFFASTPVVPVPSGDAVDYLLPGVIALANGLFLGFLMLGGIVLPIDHLPEALRPIAALLPATALADLLRISLASGLAAGTPASPVQPVLLLAAWGVAAVGLAIRTFRWD